MLTQGMNIPSDSWTNIVSAFSLIGGGSYSVQNLSDNRIKIAEKTTVPTDSDPYHYIMPNGSINIIPEIGIGIWVRSTNADANIAITES